MIFILLLWQGLLTIAANPQQLVALEDMAGVIVVFDTNNDIKQPLIELRNDYTQYVTEELNNEISHTYDLVFVGFAIKFTNLSTIHDKVLQASGNSSAILSDEQVYEGFYDLLINYKADELTKLGVSLNMLPDQSVGIYTH